MTDSGNKMPSIPPLPGDWAVATPEKTTLPVSMDDVVHGFRWILGREPQKVENITTHLRAAKGSRSALRMIFLTSAEFSRHLNRMSIFQEKDTQAVSSISAHDPARAAKIVFFHIPKTGGTSFHYHLAQCFAEEEICDIRHNTILTAPLYKLLDKRLISGHFDNRLMGAMPRQTSMVTVLRDPKARLVSVYRYMRATKEKRSVAENQPLAKVAREHNFEEFLEQAVKLNPAAVDNIYCRTFGSALPMARWEGAAEEQWTSRYKVFTEHDYQSMYDRSVSVLSDKKAHVVKLEEFEATASAFFTSQSLPVPKNFEHLKNSDEISELTDSFEPVETIDIKDTDILTQLTQWDTVLYEKFTT